ncbi:ROK family protein [Xylanimonas cellulosilytica DSM 15894]|uniref:ROK family protein n=1 Tax=Xylanimonas cellulosilytica (strain DSM 15894 / JCM 12276 / CECT 5975 / KCTC 9989 / LMG 20990 / NBRC 107835 / XIL07) TaxID=446471 RepID=D1BTT9_XYLCX|nr:ROK family protein [Xylanimonas cellulosilytica]ACZ31068.1 ROK family protein [Xylanimonas cellulosilytica DSM 15894]
MAQHLAFGIDIGGSGIKGAPVDLRTGEFAADRVRIPTPDQSTPDAVAKVLAELVGSFDLPQEAPIGVAFPAPMDHGVVRFIANLDQSWKGVDLPALLHESTGHEVTAVNDADAAGISEQRYGAAQGRDGTVLVVTLGTGIGSALIVDGVLVPNTELGHLEIDGFDAESRAADSAREREGLDFPAWAGRLQRYFETVEMLLSPDLIVVGGGVSKKHAAFLPLLDLRATIIPAKLRNAAGIVGAAAMAATEASKGHQRKH